MHGRDEPAAQYSPNDDDEDEDKDEDKDMDTSSELEKLNPL